MKKFALMTLMAFALFTLSACDELFSELDEQQPDQHTMEIEVIENEEHFNIHTFTFSDLTLKIDEEDGYYTVPLEETMLLTTEGIDEVGRHYFQGTYQDTWFDFFITLYDGDIPPHSEEEVIEYFTMVFETIDIETEGYVRHLELPPVYYDNHFTYEYLSSHPDIIHPNGSMNAPEEDTVVTITLILNYPPHTITMSHDFAIMVYGEEPLTDTYFFPEDDFPYDGPRFDMDFLDEIAYEYDAENDVYLGTGGAFYVDYTRCIDGDTTGFYYPNDIYDLIESNAKSTRYFNIDTPETTGSGEEWGRSATLYVCDLLAGAESIILQTDPGDNLLGRWGRLLAWIWIRMPGEDDYQLLNYMIVRQGLGEVAYLFGAGETDVTVYNGMTYTDWMWQAENLAIEEKLGMHGSLLDYYWDYENNQTHTER